MEKARVAFCVATYERSKLVEDFLVKCSAHYIEEGIDIYYYDSSVSDRTRDVVCGWPDQEHVHYVRMPSDMHPGAKVYKIFQGYGLKKEYDFIWLSNDACQCSRAAIEQLVSNLSPEYDIIEVINDTDAHHIGTRTFTDRNEYMGKCAWHLTLYGAALLNVHTLLEGVDWAYYEQKFLVSPLIYFSHVSFYFYRLLELDRFCARYLCMPPQSITMSSLKRTIGWARNLFYVVCEGWVQTIEGLPDYYTGKERAMSGADGFSFMRTITQFYRYKQRGIYSMRVYLKYRSVWHKVTSIPRRELFLAALVPGPAVKAFYGLRKRNGQRKLQRFCAAHERIVIYGTGVLGKLYARYFGRQGIPFEGFCVSRRKPKHTALGYPVYELAELENAAAGSVGFVLAMNRDHVGEVLSAVKKTAADWDIFCDFKFSEDIDNEEIFRAKELLWE